MGLMVVVWSDLKSCQKVKELSKVEKFQRPQRSLVQKNVYQSTNPLLIRYKELEVWL